MSQENVDLTYEVIDAFNRRDLDAYLALTDPEIELTPYEVAVQGGSPYRGHAGVRIWWEESLAVLPDLKAEIHKVRDLGNRTVLRGQLRGQGVSSGASFERALCVAVEWRDKKLVWWYAFGSEAEALEAAGLRE
jgi:hypothetical protein